MLIISILSFRDSFLGIKLKPDKTLDTWPQDNKKTYVFLELYLFYITLVGVENRQNA